MTRSQCAFIRGARGAVLRMTISSAEKVASKVGEYLSSRSRNRKRGESRRVSRSEARFLACCTTQSRVGWAVTPAMCS
jgi:hypothetical protein